MKMNLVRFIPLIIMMMVACTEKSDDQTKDNNEGKNESAHTMTQIVTGLGKIVSVVMLQVKREKAGLRLLALYTNLTKRPLIPMAR